MWWTNHVGFLISDPSRSRYGPPTWGPRYFCVFQESPLFPHVFHSHSAPSEDIEKRQIVLESHWTGLRHTYKTFPIFLQFVHNICNLSTKLQPCENWIFQTNPGFTFPHQSLVKIPHRDLIHHSSPHILTYYTLPAAVGRMRQSPPKFGEKVSFSIFWPQIVTKKIFLHIIGINGLALMSWIERYQSQYSLLVQSNNRFSAPGRLLAKIKLTPIDPAPQDESIHVYIVG